MIINLIQPMPCGNAVRLMVQGNAGEQRWRVVRRDGAAVAGPSDPAAFLVYEGDSRFLTDYRLLVNGVTYHYAVFGEVSPGVWGSPDVATVVPQATFEQLGPDPQEVVRERLEMSLNSMIQRGRLRISKPDLPVMSIPFYQQGGQLPVVTVLYTSGSSTNRGLGDVVAESVSDDDGWIGAQGWHSAVTLEIATWSLNAEERNRLRRALETALATNLGVFDDAGLHMPDVQSVQDSEDTQSLDVPVYQTFVRLGCTVVVAAADEEGLITDVESTVNVIGV